MAGQMFTTYFDKDYGNQFVDRLRETRELIDATLALQPLPDNGSIVKFTHALCELEIFSVADKRVVLDAFRRRIDDAMDAQASAST